MWVRVSSSRGSEGWVLRVRLVMVAVVVVVVVVVVGVVVVIVVVVVVVMTWFDCGNDEVGCGSVIM
jgi:hypothetical protein